MIITRLVIENYKQYRGEHILEIAEDATVGVIGANGVGKTTIFEAIEWCLYNPRSIENKNIRPRGTGGEVRVIVQMTSNNGNEVYEVERLLKRSGTQATVYKMNEHGGGEPIVQGTREVTDYISTRLIGLGHAAFVATFFTRQKELSFFGDLTPAARRREVGKLLGFETIKQAQALIADDRTNARHDADSLQRQYEAKTQSRNLDEEIEVAKATIRERTAEVEVARKSVEEAEAATAMAEQRLQHINELRDRYTAVSGELRDLETRLEHARTRESGVVQELERLDQREDERGRLAILASEEPELRAERSRMEMERERFQTRARLRDDVARNEQRIRTDIGEIGRIVERTPAIPGSEGWVWSAHDQHDAITGIDRLIGIATSVDPSTTEETLEQFRAALFEHQCIERETATLQRYRDRQKAISAELDTMMKDGEPADVRAHLESRLAEAQKRLSDAQASIASLTKQRDRARELASRLEHQHFDEACPTCGRAFSDDEAEIVIATLRSSIRQHEADIAAAGGTSRKTERELRQLEAELAELGERERAIQKLRASLESSRDYIAQQEATVSGHSTSLQKALQRINRPAAPTQEDIELIEREVHQKRALRETAQPLGMLRRSIVEAQQAIQTLESELATLEDVDWDADAFDRVRRRHDEASRAVSAVEQIDRELARRPQLEHDLATTRASIAELEVSIAEHRSARDAIGFDPEALRAAMEEQQAVRQAESAARNHLHESDNAARDAVRLLESLEREKADLGELAVQAEEKRRLREELDLMYSEFSEFDKFVAQRVSPRLSDTTSDIVAEMTDGKYDRVVFNEDYGIEVYDQSGDRFALETFSGGERDAISLAARLALSRLIGSQASNPPSFVVLDEVFGSLDAERRERVLTLLGQHSHEFFRQMFIISHIDDVQQSPVFDTVWQVVQREDGTSEVVTGNGDRDALVAD